MTRARRLAPPKVDRPPAAQCCVRIADPAHAPGWRKHRYGPGATKRSRYHEATGQLQHVDPALCVRGAVVEIDGLPYCSIHGGQVALKLLLGEP